MDKRRIVDAPQNELDEFTCGICHDIVFEPKETQCCQQLYCGLCITEWLSQSKCCPNDREELDAKGLKTPSRIILNLLNGMKVKCEFHNRGCDHITRYDNIDKHITLCNKNPQRICETCGTKMTPDTPHNCIDGLMNQIAIMTDHMTQLKLDYQSEQKILI